MRAQEIRLFTIKSKYPNAFLEIERLNQEIYGYACAGATFCDLPLNSKLTESERRLISYHFNDEGFLASASVISNGIRISWMPLDQSIDDFKLNIGDYGSTSELPAS